MAANPKITPLVQPIAIDGVEPTPKKAEIAYDGSIQFDASDDCTIEWADEHGKKDKYWDPQPPTVKKGLNDVQLPLSATNHHVLKYTLVNDKATQGGGTVKIGS